MSGILESSDLGWFNGARDRDNLFGRGCSSRTGSNTFEVSDVLTAESIMEYGVVFFFFADILLASPFSLTNAPHSSSSLMLSISSWSSTIFGSAGLSGFQFQINIINILFVYWIIRKWQMDLLTVPESILIAAVLLEIFFSLCRNIDVLASCRRHSIPSFILLCGCFFRNSIASCGYFVWNVGKWWYFSFWCICRGKSQVEHFTSVVRAIETRLLSDSNDVVWSTSTLEFFCFSFRLDEEQFDGHIQKIIRRMQHNKPIPILMR